VTSCSAQLPPFPTLSERSCLYTCGRGCVRAWQGIISPRGVAGSRVAGAPQPQISPEELLFRLDGFVRTMQECAKVRTSGLELDVEVEAGV
jgi:hypothetical protein